MNTSIDLNHTPLPETLGEIAFIMLNGNQENVITCDFLRNDFVTPQIRRVHDGLQYYLTPRFDLQMAWDKRISTWSSDYEKYIYETGEEDAAGADLKLTDWIPLTD